MIESKDKLGISDIENRAIDALSAGAPQEDVDIASRGRASVTMVSPSQAGPLDLDESDFEEPKLKYTGKFSDDVSDFDPVNTDYLKPRMKEKSARTAMYTSLAVGNPNEYGGMYDQLSTQGYSSNLDILQQEVDGRNKESLLKDVDKASYDGDVEALEELYKAAPSILKDNSLPTISALNNVAESFSEDSEGNDRNREHTRNFLEGMHSWAITRQKIIDNVVMPEIAKNDVSATAVAADFGELFLPGGEQLFGLASVTKDIFGERYNFLSGTMFKDLSDYISSKSTPDEQMHAAIQVVESISKHSGVFVDNDFIKTYALDSLKIMMEAPGGDDPVTRWILDVLGVVDAASLIPKSQASRFIKKLWKLKSNKSSLHTYDAIRGEVAELNPDLESVLGKRALDDPETAAQLGSSSESELLKVLPKSQFDEDTKLAGAPNSLLNKFYGTRTKAEEVINFVDNTFKYADEEFKVKERRILNALSDSQISAIARPSETEIVSRNLNKNSITIRATYGDDTDIPLTLSKALDLKRNIEAAIADEGINGSAAELFVKNKSTGLLEKYVPEDHLRTIPERRKVMPMTVSDRRGHLFKAPFKIPGEVIPEKKVLKDSYSGFVVSTRTEAPMRWMDTLPGEVLGEGATKGFGMFSRWYINPQGYIDQRLLGAFRLAGDQKGFIKTEMFDLIKPFTTLSYFNKKKVANLLEVGDQNEHVFSFRELKNGGYSDKVIEAYYSTRILEDAMYRVKNFSTRKRLVDEGYRAITVNRGGTLGLFQNAGRIIQRIPNDVSEIFDTNLGRGVRVTSTTMRDLTEKGMTVAKLLAPIDSGAARYTYAIVRNDSLHELPPNIFPYRPGHSMRINKDPYFIDMHKHQIEDGAHKMVKRTIAVEPNNFKARQTLDKLNNIAGTGEVYKIRIDRNFSLEKSALETDIDALKNVGESYWFSPRGDRLRRLTDNSLSAVEDPLTALDKATSSVANVATHGDLLEVSVERHRRTYGHLRGNNDRPLWYFYAPENSWKFDKTAAQGFNNKAVRAALHEYEWLEDMKYTPTTVDVKWKQLMAEFDSTLGGFGDLVSTASKKVFLDTLGATTPGKAARGFAFATTIPLRPLRHIVLQSTTGMYLTGIDPVNTVKSFRDTGLLMMSMAAYKQPKVWDGVKKWAKLYGYEEGEWEEVFEAFRKSGKPYSVDSHIAVGEFNYSWSRSIPDTLAGEVGRKALNTLKSPITVGKAIGFDVGELGNQSMTWLFAKRQWEKLNPGKKWNSTQRYLDEINVNARNLSVDMTKTDALRYQKGAFASMTQFLAIHNKMIMKILPKTLGGDPTLSGKTAAETAKIKGKLITGLLAVYGTAGLGLQGWYDNWKKENNVQVDPLTDRFLFGGINEVLFGSAFDLAFGEKLGTNRSTFSASNAPTSGIFSAPAALAKNLWEGNFLEVLSGPSGSQFPNVFKAATFAKQAWGFDDLTTLEKAGLSMEVAAEEFGMFSDYFRYNVAMAYKENLDKLYMIGKDGRPTAEANSAGEIWARLLFATGNRDEFELYNKWLPSAKENRSFGKGNVGAIDKDAKQLAKWMMREWTKSGGDYTKFSERTYALTFSLHRGNRLYGLELWKETMRYFEDNPKFSKFVENYAKDFMLMDPHAVKQDLVNYINNSDYTPQQDKEHLIRTIDQLEITRDESKELLDRILEEK